MELSCVCAKSLQSYLTLCNPINYGLQGSYVHGAPPSMGLLQERILEWVTMPFSRAPSRLRGWACVSCTAGGFFTTEPPGRLKTAIWASNSTPRFSSAQLLSHVRLWDSMDCSMPGFPVHHHLLEFAQTHVHEVGDGIQPISSSVVPFSSCPQSFPASGSFPVSQFFTSDGQSIGVSASASVLPMNIQDWFPLGLTGWVSLQSTWLSEVFSNTTVQKHQFFSAQISS